MGIPRHLHVERRHVLDEARLVHVEVDARHAIGVGVGLGVFPEDVVVVENEPVVFEDGDRVVALYELVGGVVVVAGGQCEGREGQKEKFFHRSLCCKLIVSVTPHSRGRPRCRKALPIDSK